MTALDTADQQKVSAPLDAASPCPTPCSRFGRWWGRKGDDAHRAGPRRCGRAALSTRATKRQRDQLRQCFDARLTDVAANAAAQAWQDEYEAAVEPLRQAMLGVLAEVAAVRDAAGSQPATASGLSQALSNARIRFFKRFAALHGQRGNSACGLHS
jgi:malonyl-CoA decarboxylase